MLVGIACWWGVLLHAEASVHDCAAYLMKESYHPLNRHIVYRPLGSPLVSYSENRDGKLHEKVELAEIMSVDDPEVQKILDYIHKRGGQVRLLKSRVSTEGSTAVEWLYESPYFWVNLDAKSESFLIPVIGLDLTTPGGLPALAHEFEHFQLWWAEFQKALLVNPDREAASRAADARVWETEMVAYGERLAVDAEMRVERDFPENKFNRRFQPPRPNLFWQPGFVNRVTYPEFQAARIVLKKDRDGLRERYIGQMLATAIDIRNKALAHLPADHPARAYWQDTSVVDLLLEPFGADRLVSDQTLDLFTTTARRLCLERTQDAQLCR